MNAPDPPPQPNGDGMNRKARRAADARNRLTRLPGGNGGGGILGPDGKPMTTRLEDIRDMQTARERKQSPLQHLAGVICQDVAAMPSFQQQYDNMIAWRKEYEAKGNVLRPTQVHMIELMERFAALQAWAKEWIPAHQQLVKDMEADEPAGDDG